MMRSSIHPSGWFHILNYIEKEGLSCREDDAYADGSHHPETGGTIHPIIVTGMTTAIGSVIVTGMIIATEIAFVTEMTFAAEIASTPRPVFVTRCFSLEIHPFSFAISFEIDAFASHRSVAAAAFSKIYHRLRLFPFKETA